MDNIYVKPSADVKRVSVATDLVDDVHYPIYKQAFSADGVAPVPVSADDPMPVSFAAYPNNVMLAKQTEVMQSVLHEMKLLNARFEEAFRTNMTTGDVSDEN